MLKNCISIQNLSFFGSFSKSKSQAIYLKYKNEKKTDKSSDNSSRKRKTIKNNKKF